MKSFVDEIIVNEIAPDLISQLSFFEENHRRSALQKLTRLFSVSKEYTQVLLNHQLSSHIPSLLNSQDEEIQRNALLLLAEIISQSREQPQKVIYSSLLHKIKESLVNGGISLKMEASHVISNIVDSASQDQIEELVAAGFVEALCRLLGSCNTSIITVSLNLVAFGFRF